MKPIHKPLFAAFLCTLMVCASVISAHAGAMKDLPAGEYAIDAKLSCYVSAMGGIEFGGPLLKSAKVASNGDGKLHMTLALDKSSVTIYGVTCDTFVDKNPSAIGEDRGVQNGTVGYYDRSGALHTDGVKTTLSKDTALNAAGNAVHYVDSIAFPVSVESGEYRLTLYINSNVMGVQFCEKNSRSTAQTYPAVLTVNWSSATVSAAANGSSQTTASTGTAKPATPSENAANPDNTDSGAGDVTTVVQDGLNIHYADGNGSSATAAPVITTEVQYFAYMNKTALLIIGACAAVLVAAGVILMISAKKTKKDAVHADESANEGETDE
ncbi:MAG: hypothetical protein LBJ12_06450 [Oscillospiraceae bacterium]|nr:hypothetical protein [Oscillospiraceae bacterium]